MVEELSETTGEEPTWLLSLNFLNTTCPISYTVGNMKGCYHEKYRSGVANKNYTECTFENCPVRIEEVNNVTQGNSTKKEVKDN